MAWSQGEQPFLDEKRLLGGSELAGACLFGSKSAVGFLGMSASSVGLGTDFGRVLGRPCSEMYSYTSFIQLILD